MRIFLLGLVVASIAQKTHAYNVDQVKTMKCTVTKSSIYSTYLPPQPGDTIVLSTRQIDIWDLHFKSPTNPGFSYIGAPSMHRVDHGKFRTPDLRTFGAVEQAYAGTIKTEYVLTLKSNETGALSAEYTSSAGPVCGNSGVINESVQMDCIATELR